MVKSDSTETSTTTRTEVKEVDVPVAKKFEVFSFCVMHLRNKKGEWVMGSDVTKDLRPVVL